MKALWRPASPTKIPLSPEASGHHKPKVSFLLLFAGANFVLPVLLFPMH